MKLILAVLLTTFTFALAPSHSATPEAEKAFVESYKKAFEAKDDKALKGFLYTEGATPDIIEMFTRMSVADAGQKISSIELITPTKEEAARYNEAMEMPDGVTYKMPFKPSKQLVIVIEKKTENENSKSTTKKPVGEKDGKLVIPLPVPAKASAPAKKKK